MMIWMVETNYDDGRCTVAGVFSTEDAAGHYVDLLTSDDEMDPDNEPAYSVSKWIVDYPQGGRLEP